MEYPRQQSAEAWAAQLNFAAIEEKHGLPSGVLTNLVRQESRGNCDAKSPKGAAGLCQFMPRTAAAMGVDASDPVSSINGAARYLEDLMDMFEGDPEKAIAAYNYGPGNMRKLLRNHPNDWKDHLPKETSDYLRIVSKGIGESYMQLDGDEKKRAAPLEEARRMAQGKEEGLQFLAGMDILGSLFFALIAMVLEKKYDAAEAKSTGEPTLPAQTTPQNPRNSGPQRGDEWNINRAMPVVNADPAERISPLPIKHAVVAAVGTARSQA